MRAIQRRRPARSPPRLSARLRAAAIKSPLPGGPSGDPAHLVADWQTRIPNDVRALADDWGNPAAWEGMTAAGGVDLPGEVAGIVGLDELVIHGWDLAKATGHPAGYEGPGLDEVLQLVTEFRGGGIEGLFGPEVPIPHEASVLDRILGVSGRDPGWQPPVGAPDEGNGGALSAKVDRADEKQALIEARRAALIWQRQADAGSS